MKFGDFVKVKSLQTVENFKNSVQELGLDIPCDEDLLIGDASPMAKPLQVGKFKIGNRYAIHPMEGWDGNTDGSPSDNTRRRWNHFGKSGAKLIWGGEAVAVRHDGRANPHQLLMDAKNQSAIAQLRESLVTSHREAMGSDKDLLIGLQLTHSGRFCKPNNNQMEPRVLFNHPLLDGRFGPAQSIVVMSDGDIERLIEDFVVAAKRAWDCGFEFVDLKHCHGYLGHEFLGAKTRTGKYGGSMEHRTRFLKDLVSGIRAEVPQLGLGVRLSAFDFLPFRPDPALSKPDELGPGIAVDASGSMPYKYGFGLNEADPHQVALNETFEFLEVVENLNIQLMNITLGSPYYNPHLTRPAMYPPSDGYQPPEDPLVGVARHLDAVRKLKQRFPQMAFVGSGYTYLQEFLPYVAPRTHGALLPRVTCRCARRTHFPKKTFMPNFQRLHYSTSQWHGVWLLPSGCTLQKITTNDSTNTDQKSSQSFLISENSQYDKDSCKTHHTRPRKESCKYIAGCANRIRTLRSWWCASRSNCQNGRYQQTDALPLLWQQGRLVLRCIGSQLRTQTRFRKSLGTGTR
jgi:2,4-dienoyl-CoA reductase-like NADH-dependent reductase (Old Yellow Enzyme family)